MKMGTISTATVTTRSLMGEYKEYSGASRRCRILICVLFVTVHFVFPCYGIRVLLVYMCLDVANQKAKLVWGLRMACHCGGNSTSALLKVYKLDLSCVIRNTHKQTPPEQCPPIKLKIYVQKSYVRGYFQRNYVRDINPNYFPMKWDRILSPRPNFPVNMSTHVMSVKNVTNYVNNLCPKNSCPGYKSEFFSPWNKTGH